MMPNKVLLPEVIIAVGGRFHAFELAEQLQKKGCLRYIVTSNPRFSLKGVKIDPKRIKTFPLAEAVGRGINRLTGSDRGNYWKSVVFDRFVSATLGPCDAFVTLAGFCFSSMQVVKRRGGKVILDRACPHILEQDRLIREEAAVLGVNYSVDSRMIERMLSEYEVSDVVVVPSVYSKNSFVSRGFAREKIQIARLSGKFPGPPALPDRRHQKLFRVLYVGGNFLRKGLVYLLRAWNGLNLKNAELILRTSDRLDPPEIRRLLNHPTIRVVGYQRDLAPLYTQASILCLPSVDDGFGMAAFEAMSYGLPVIVTENVGAADRIRDGIEGFVVKIRDVDALQEKILYLYECREKRLSMSEAAWEQAAQVTWDDYGKAFLDILQRCVEKG